MLPSNKSGLCLSSLLGGASWTDVLVQALRALWCNRQTALLAKPNQQPVGLTPQVSRDGKGGGGLYQDG